MGNYDQLAGDGAMEWPFALMAQAGSAKKKTTEPDDEPAGQTPVEPPHHHRSLLHHWWLSTFPAVIAITLVAVWAVGNLFFAHYKLAGQLVSAHNSEQKLEQLVSNSANSYKLSITYPDGSTKTFPLGDIGLTVQPTATVAAAKRQQKNLANRLQWWKPIPINLVLKVNATTLQNFISQHVSEVEQPAKNASLSIQNGTVQLASAVAGKQYGVSNALQTITTSAEELQPQPIKLHLITLQPTLTDTELTSAEQQLKQIIGQHITLTIGSQSVVPTPATIASWLQLTPNIQTKTVDISVSSAAVSSYLGRVASSYVHPARDQVNVTNADGSTSLLVAGSVGETVGGEQAATATIASNLLASKGLQLNLTTASTSYGTITAGNWAKWIEVDLTTKRMYAYQYGQQVNSFLVSAGKPSTPTPTGEFHIWEKLTSQTMTGPGYVQPNVPWVNYFDHSGDAIHGNYWRSASTFGNVNTSHGCVGVPVAQGQWIYDWAPIGTPVIIHL